MTFPRTIVLAVAAAALLPAPAEADVRMVSRDVPLDLARTTTALRSLSADRAPLEFNLVGLHWRGPGTVWFRTAGEGDWSAWRPAAPEEEDAPDTGSAEAARSRAWKLGNPYWTGSASRIQYRLSGKVVRLRAFFIHSDVTAERPQPARAQAMTRAAAPQIIRRGQWGADESIVRNEPRYAERVVFASVHHTAGTNAYTAAQSAAIVRGIQRYHVLANGWDDIGYNFLVSKHGQVFEGRRGGMTRPVVGAHARGFNTGSVGVAALGTFSGVSFPSAGRAALQRLLAWRLDVAHVDPLSRLYFVSYGNERFNEGARVRLRAVSGHRDTGLTTCPGSRLYARLGAIATAVSTIGLPKLYAPRVAGSVGRLVRFTGRLSAARAWQVQVKDAAGNVLATGTGTGRTIDWTWDARRMLYGRYTYTMSSGTAVRPAAGVVPSPPPLRINGPAAVPFVLTPNGDGHNDRTRISFALTTAATVRVTVLAGGTLVRTLATGLRLGAGRASFAWAGRRDDRTRAPDGAYTVRVRAVAGVNRAAGSDDVLVDRTLGSLAISPTRFSPNGDGLRESVLVRFRLVRQAQVLVRVRRGGLPLTTLLFAPLSAGQHEVRWDGRIEGARQPDGRYEFGVHAQTRLGKRSLYGRFVLDTTGPRVTIRSARRVNGGTRLRLLVNEAARLTIWYGRARWNDGTSIVVNRRAGTHSIWRPVRARVVRVVGRDTVGNLGRAVGARVRVG